MKPDLPANQKEARKNSAREILHRRVHMANERTLLAWIRTSISIMAFGFVVEKFAIFLRQFAITEGVIGLRPAVPPGRGYSSVFGAVLVGIGALLGLLSFVRYLKVQKQIDKGVYYPSFILDVMLVISVVAIAVFLLFYLVHSV